MEADGEEEDEDCDSNVSECTMLIQLGSMTYQKTVVMAKEVNEVKMSEKMEKEEITEKVHEIEMKEKMEIEDTTKEAEKAKNKEIQVLNKIMLGDNPNRLSKAHIFFGEENPSDGRDGIQKLPVTIEVVDDEKERAKHNARRKKFSCTRLCFGSVGAFVVAGQYEYTLDQFLKMDECKCKFWIFSGGKYRMSPMLQNILKKQITKTNTMANEGHIFHLGLDIIGLSKDLEPQFTNLKITRGDGFYLWSCLQKVVRKIADEVPSKDKLHKELKIPVFHLLKSCFQWSKIKSSS